MRSFQNQIPALLVIRRDLPRGYVIENVKTPKENMFSDRVNYFILVTGIREWCIDYTQLQLLVKNIDWVF